MSNNAIILLLAVGALLAAGSFTLLMFLESRSINYVGQHNLTDIEEFDEEDDEDEFSPYNLRTPSDLNNFYDFDVDED